jgi:hypothetical protein
MCILFYVCEINACLCVSALLHQLLISFSKGSHAIHCPCIWHRGLRYEFESPMRLASAERLPTPDLAGPATFRSILLSDISNLHTSIHVLTYVISAVRWNRHCSVSRLVSRLRSERLWNRSSIHKQFRILLHSI